MRPAAGAQAEIGILGAYDPFKQSWCVWYVNSSLLECDLLHIAAADLSAQGESSANDKVHNTQEIYRLKKILWKLTIILK